MDIQEIEKLIGYEFRDKEILKKALTHSSFGKYAENYEKLEFFGDAFLNFVIAKHLFANRPNLSVGDMTKQRAQIVCTENLRNATNRLGLWSHVRRDGNARNQDSKKKLFGDIFESIAGGIYIDGGEAESEKFILKALSHEINSTINCEELFDFKTYLQEYIQSKKMGIIKYTSKDISKNPQNPLFESTLTVGGKEVAKGEGESKKKASQACAKNAMESYGLKRE